MLDGLHQLGRGWELHKPRNRSVRIGLWLLLALLGCCLAFQIGDGQGLVIVNRRPSLGTPEDTPPPVGTVLEFGPVRPPLGTVLEIVPPNRPITGALLFEPMEPNLPLIMDVAPRATGAAEIESDEPPSLLADATLPKFMPVAALPPVVTERVDASPFERPVFTSALGQQSADSPNPVQPFVAVEIETSLREVAIIPIRFELEHELEILRVNSVLPQVEFGTPAWLVQPAEMESSKEIKPKGLPDSMEAPRQESPPRTVKQIMVRVRPLSQQHSSPTVMPRRPLLDEMLFDRYGRSYVILPSGALGSRLFGR